MRTIRLIGRYCLLDSLGIKSTVVGWGYAANYDDGDFTRSGVAKSILQKASLPVVPLTQCQGAFSRRMVDGTHLCAGGVAGGADSCKGDSGGGLFVRKNTTNFGELESSPYLLVGVVSFGSSQCGVGVPGVYTRVSKFVDWIKNSIRQ